MPLSLTPWLSRALVPVAIAAGLALAPAAAQTPDDAVVATVNGEAITEGDLRSVAEEFGVADQMSQLRVELIDAAIDMRLMATAAVANGLDQSPEFLARMEFARERELRTAYFAAYIESQITDEQVRAIYDQEVGAFDFPEEVLARHILVATEAEANEIIALLNTGANFAELARTRSLDTSSGPQGGGFTGLPGMGEGGYFTRGVMVQEFEDAAFSIPPGTIGQSPVQSQFGWHVIAVDDRRDQPPPPFDLVADQIRSDMLQNLYLELVGGLRDQATISVPELETAPAPAAQ